MLCAWVGVGLDECACVSATDLHICKLTCSLLIFAFKAQVITLEKSSSKTEEGMRFINLPCLTKL